MEHFIAFADLSGRYLDAKSVLSPAPAVQGGAASQEIGSVGYACAVTGSVDLIDVAIGPRFLVILHGAVFLQDEPPTRIGFRQGPRAVSDAHALKEMWSGEGVRCLHRLRGSFAAVIFDVTESRLWFFRDPIGLKPMFFAPGRGGFVLGTEARAVQRNIPGLRGVDRGVVAGFLLQCSSALDSQSLLSGVQRVPPGCICQLRREQGEVRLNIESYWHPAQIRETWGISLLEAGEQLGNLLTTAVLRATWSERSVVSMSGGLDSTTLWSVAHEAQQRGLLSGKALDSVSIVFPGLGCDESVLINKVHERLGTRPSVLINGVVSEGFREIAPRLAGLLDSPQFPTDYMSYLVAQAGSRLGARTMITGHGSDQLMFRNASYIAEDLARMRLQSFCSGLRDLATVDDRRYKLRVLAGLPRLAARFAWQIARAAPRQPRQRPSWLSLTAWREFLARGFPANGRPVTDVKRRQSARVIARAVQRQQLPGELLHRKEMLARTLGLSFEAPFFDRDVLDFLLTLPNSITQAGGWDKGLLRRLAGGLLPPSVAWRNDRTSFEALFPMIQLSSLIPQAGKRWLLTELGLTEPAALDKLVENAHIEWDSRVAVAHLSCAELFVRSVSGFPPEQARGGRK